MAHAMRVAAWLFGVQGVTLAGIGTYFIAIRPAFLPEDLRFLSMSTSDLDQLVPHLGKWVRRVFVVLGGHALAAGGLTIFVAATDVREGHGAAVLMLALAGTASIGLMAGVNFAIGSDFRWVLLVPAGLVAFATAAAIWW